MAGQTLGKPPPRGRVAPGAARLGPGGCGCGRLSARALAPRLAVGVFSWPLALSSAWRATALCEGEDRPLQKVPVLPGRKLGSPGAWLRLNTTLEASHAAGVGEWSGGAARRV